LALPKHTPYKCGEGGVRIGLKPINTKSWLEIDDNFKNEHNLKKNLLSSNRHEVFQAKDKSHLVQKELLGLITAHIKEYHSEKYLFEGQNIFIKATGENINLVDKNTPPIETASFLVQEDLVLMNPREDKFYLEAAVLTAPSHWSLVEKFSKSLMDVHEGVPGYQEKIGTRVDQIFNKLPSDRILERFNWSIFDSPELFQPVRSKPDVTIKKKGIQDLYLRVERQTIRKLPNHGSIVFTIRVHVDPLLSISKEHGLLNDLNLAIANLPQEMKEYKLIDQIEKEVTDWIQENKQKIK
jgi:hypothetical protein